MSSSSDKVLALRRLLDERFPVAAPRETRLISTGVPQLDGLLDGGLCTGTLTEFVSSEPSAGSQLSLGSILLSTRLSRKRMALVDAANAFDVETFDDDLLAHVVWIRAGKLADCWRAADLATRDPNYAVVAIDVRGFPERELLRTKDGVWVRLQRAAEQAETALVIQTTTPLVPNAARRITFVNALASDSLVQLRADLIENLAPELQRVRIRTGTAR